MSRQVIIFGFVANTVRPQGLDGDHPCLGVDLVVAAHYQATFIAGERVIDGKLGATAIAVFLHVEHGEPVLSPHCIAPFVLGQRQAIDGCRRDGNPRAGFRVAGGAAGVLLGHGGGEDKEGGGGGCCFGGGGGGASLPHSLLVGRDGERGVVEHRVGEDRGADGGGGVVYIGGGGGVREYDAGRLDGEGEEGAEGGGDNGWGGAAEEGG